MANEATTQPQPENWVTLSVMLVDAIAGAGFPNDEFAQRCADQRVAYKSVGAGGWVWDREALLKWMPEEELQLLYISIKNFDAYSANQPGA